MVTANKFAVRRSVKFPIPLAIVLGLISWAGLTYYSRGDESLVNAVFLPLLLLLIVMLAVVQYVLLPWQSRRHFRETAAFSDEISVEWDEQQFRLGGKRGNMALAWSDFYRWAENDEMILLYQSHVLYHVVPKAALSQDQAGDIIAQLERAGVKRR